MLQVNPNRPLSRTLLSLIHVLDDQAKQLGISYFIIGATARDIVLQHVHGVETARATVDVDFAVAVSTWEAFSQLKENLTATGAFVAGAASQHLIFDDGVVKFPLDLVPFDGVERDGEIVWPPKGDFVMNVAGYADAYDSALEIELEPGFPVKVVSLPAMTVLKMLAWKDRAERTNDATDVLLILRNYHLTGQADRIFAEAPDLMDAFGYDLELAGAGLLGRDAKRDVAPETLAQVRDLFADEKYFLRFCTQMNKVHVGGMEAVIRLFNAFLDEIRK